MQSMNYSAAYPQTSLIQEPHNQSVDNSGFYQSKLVGGRRKRRTTRKFKRNSRKNKRNGGTRRH